MSAERAIQAWVVRADLFLCEAWPWLLATVALFALTAWILMKRG